MAIRAGESVLASWGGERRDITHLVFGSMSATIDAPTMDARLIAALGLPCGTQRLCVQQMGCLTGFRCLSLARELSVANPSARVLVIVADVRSGLQNQLPPYSPGDPLSKATIISCSLFR